MPAFLAICHWLEHTAMGTTVRDSVWLFPTIEVVHIFGIVLLVGSTSILDLRLTGCAFREDSVVKLARRFLPWTWTGFALMAITGFFLFASESSKMYDNLAFRIKILMIVLAGVNAFVFHTVAYRKVENWNEGITPPVAARLAGWCSMLLWIGIAVAGRVIAYL
jgi:hypothetical protein